MKKITILAFIFCMAISPIFSQNLDGTVTLPDHIPYEYVIIRDVKISGNKLTKPWYIIRELDFAEGDTLATKKGVKHNLGQKRVSSRDSSELALRLKYSRENIINTKLFLTVNIGMEQIDGNQYRLVIDVNERHYWWMFPVVKLNAPNFNEWLRDIDWSALSMGLFFSHNNLFGISHQTSLVGYVGKSYAAAFGYRIPWIGQGKKTGLTFGAAYENLYTVEYASVENKRQMLYAPNSRQSAKIFGIINSRPGLYNYWTVKLLGEWVSISDSLHTLDSNYLAKGKKSNLTFNLYVDYAYDSRNSKSYPLFGSYLCVFAQKIGMGMISRDVDYFFYGIDFHFYQKLSKKWYVAEMLKLVNSSGENQPYYYQLNLGYKKDFIRGYDLYTLKGDEMYYFRSNIKYQLVNPAIKKAKEGQEKSKFKNLQYALYLNAFTDAGYVTNRFTENNPYNNKMLFSWGFGLDFVTYYDMTLRFEYAFTSIGKYGFYFGFGMPI